MSSINIYLLIILGLMIFLSLSVQLNQDQMENLVEKRRKQYCRIMSLHYLHSDMKQFEKFTSEFDNLKKQVFKNRLAGHLALICEHRITKQQIKQLTQLLQSNKNESHHKMLTLQQHYIKYFSPDQSFNLQILKQINSTDSQQLQKQIKFIKKQQQLWQKSALQLKSAFQGINHQIKKTSQHMFDALDKIMKGIEGLFSNISKVVENVKNHPHFKIIQGYIDQL